MTQKQQWLCQGGLDMQYLSARYENGKAKAGEFMQKRHCTVQHKNIVLAHGDIVEKQAQLGPSALLAAILLTVDFRFLFLLAVCD